ncbi:class I SAM-dependent methyltransferase [Amycolatopsis sulphurea]|uniref:class I SAM-dependent methyltransferase n=1 Tax=Amycolatopsis sulphurea TaxID=76022 RepID=UPI0024832313|nr:methyltransferase domain-containing protein [Amycolatopsis sulphurea]
MVKGVTGSMDEEVRLATELLGLQPGAVVLDVACGTGRFTHAFGDAVGPDGLAIGLDGTVGMLSRALDEPYPPTVAYLRADAVQPPLESSTVDAVCCFAALHVFAEPERALDSFARAAESYCSPRRVKTGSLPDSLTQQEESSAGSGCSTAGRSRPGPRARGFQDVWERYFGLAQLVSGGLADGERSVFVGPRG